MVLVGFAISATVFAQHVEFEVASVKRCTERGFDDFGGGGRGPGAAASIAVDPARIRIECRTVESLIVQAYVLFGNGHGRSMPAVIGEPFVQGGSCLDQV
jgi:hypothetical protein